MSISSSLSNALSGLTAAARAAEVVSSNVSNALTEGYGRRELELSSRSLAGNGAGVKVEGVRRVVDQQVLGDRRLADASLGDISTRAGFLAQLEGALGQPDDPGSLTGRLATMEASLIEAASRPDSETRLRAVLDAATDVAGKITSASDAVQGIRMQSDREIAVQVSGLNDGLRRVADLNREIRAQIGAGYDAAGLMDLRQQEVDKLSAIIPMREVQRDNGQIALFTPGGAILVEGKAAEIAFAPAGVIVPQMTLASGGLSGLTINGQPIDVGPKGPLAGGSLSGLFAVRDDLAVSAQTRLDAVARDLIERFRDPAVDPTLGVTDAGLFTDQGLAFLPADELGLSARLSVNALADPSRGGDLWKLRDGLGAATPGDPGNASGLIALADALTAARSPVSGGFLGAPRSAVGLAGDFLSLVHTELQSSEAEQSFSLTRADSLKALELQGGVDTDHEMQQLLLIEQAYAANARVISTVDEMIQTLLGL
ncbi:MAG: flagellar hook-associated protein FlgK [Paracoccaceae bacterium]